MYNNNNNINIKSDAGVYSIQCLVCNRKYVSEISGSIKKQINKHNRNIKIGQEKNTFVNKQKTKVRN